MLTVLFKVISFASNKFWCIMLNVRQQIKDLMLGAWNNNWLFIGFLETGRSEVQLSNSDTKRERERFHFFLSYTYQSMWQAIIVLWLRFLRVISFPCVTSILKLNDRRKFTNVIIEWKRFVTHAHDPRVPYKVRRVLTRSHFLFSFAHSCSNALWSNKST